MSTPPRPPRVYGNPKKLRSSLARYINRGEELLDEAQGVRRRMEAMSESQRKSLDTWVAEQAWVEDVKRWRWNGRSVMRRALGEAAEEEVPVFLEPLPPETGKPRHTMRVSNMEPWLREALGDLRSLQARIGVSRNVTAVSPASGRFEELRASGLVASDVVDGYAREMTGPRTPKQLYDAIGAAKELTEATLRVALARLGESYAKTDDLPRLMKLWRKAAGTLAPPDPAGAATLDRAQAALAGLVTFLAEWRNAYGRGHGRPQYPPGLTARHARLASDAAETAVRFIVSTMDDLERLAP